MNQQHNYSAKTRKENHMEENTFIVEKFKSPNPRRTGICFYVSPLLCYFSSVPIFINKPEHQLNSTSISPGMQMHSTIYSLIEYERLDDQPNMSNCSVHHKKRRTKFALIVPYCRTDPLIVWYLHISFQPRLVPPKLKGTLK